MGTSQPPTHYVLVESKRHGDYKSFSIRLPTFEKKGVEKIIMKAISRGLETLSDEFHTGVVNDAHSHKIRILTGRKVESDQRHVMSRWVRKPFHSSEEIAMAIKDVLVLRGYA